MHVHEEGLEGLVNGENGSIGCFLFYFFLDAQILCLR